MGIFDELGRRVTNAGQKTVQKTKEFSESARINVLIGDEEKKIKNACCEIGKIYASLHKNDYEPEVASWMEIVNEAEQKIEDYKRQIEATSNSSNKHTKNYLPISQSSCLTRFN